MIREVTDRELRFGRMLYERRSDYEKEAFRLLPTSMQNNVVSNYPVAFTEHDYAYFPDFLFAKEKLVIEIDGLQHLRQVERDRLRDEIFKDNGYVVVRIPAQTVQNPFEFWFNIFCEFAKVERKKNRASLSSYIDDLNAMYEQFALTMCDSQMQ